MSWRGYVPWPDFRCSAVAGFWCSVTSSSEKLLLRCAWSLFDGRAKLALDDIAFSLDVEEFSTLIEAIRIRGGYRLEPRVLI